MKPTSQFTTYASFSKRLAAFAVDTLIVVALSSAISFIMQGTFLASSVNAAANLRDWGDFFISLLAPAVILYMLGTSGQTPGCRILGIKVVDSNSGAPIGIPRAVGRYLFASFISGPALLLGYLWMLWSPRKQTWHDTITSAVVVPESTAPQTSAFPPPPVR